jgi:hypothetical protein
LKDNILDAGGLSCRPMNGIYGSSRWNIRRIDNEVTYLPVEDSR